MGCGASAQIKADAGAPKIAAITSSLNALADALPTAQPLDQNSLQALDAAIARYSAAAAAAGWEHKFGRQGEAQRNQGQGVEGLQQTGSKGGQDEDVVAPNQQHVAAASKNAEDMTLHVRDISGHKDMITVTVHTTDEIKASLEALTNGSVVRVLYGGVEVEHLQQSWSALDIDNEELG